MEVRTVLKSALRANAQLKTMVERRNRYARLEACHSAGTVRALEALQQKLDNNIEEVARLALEAEACIEAVEAPLQQEVLRCRYLDGRDWQDIARQMDLSLDWVKHLHTQAMKELEGKKVNFL